ncbi:hypothetical protein [Ferruginibacter profundus]
MAKKQIKYILDFVPLLILLVYAINLIWILRTSNIQIVWPNIIGFILLPLIIFLIIWRHQVGVIALGLLLFLGLFGAISFTNGITTFGMGFGKGEDKVSFNIYGDPIYLLFLLIHFILSGRYYVGIITKKYWQELFQVIKQQPNN